MSKRTGIIILLIVVALFSIVAAVGFAKDDDEPGDGSPGWIDFLGERLIIKQPLDKKDIGIIAPSAYKQQVQQGLISMQPGSSCTFIIRESSSLLPTVRVLTLHLEEGPDVQFMLKQKDRLTVKEVLSSSEGSKAFDVYDEGGAITILTDSSGNSTSLLRLE